MRCPKCHYISFGSSDRCRNCGYEFLLAVETPPVDLPIRTDDQAIGPLADFVLSERVTQPVARSGAAETAASARRASQTAAPRFDLPLFGGGIAGADAPLVAPAAVPRPPLSVRRSQPTPRPRSERALLSDDPEPRTPQIVHLGSGRSLEVACPRDVPLDPPKVDVIEPASVVARVLAGLVDVLLLAAIDSAIVYYTLLLVDLPLRDAASLPLAPLAVFLLLLNGGYLAIFTTAGGQTIGKMLTGIRVVADLAAEGTDPGRAVGRVGLGASVLRAMACLVSLLPAGLGFAVILFDSDGRALHDRLAETRVVKA
jgi:uncharacterized RDD family membrane protein YckC